MMDGKQLADALEATRDYYEARADEFDARTRGREMADLYGAFLPLIPAGGHILDAGCGPGRDSTAFLAHGYRVTAFDASEAMVRLATVRLAQPVLRLSFEQLRFDREFDGVWACASLLHVPREQILDALARLRRALVPGGVLFASFKTGTAEELREDRLFTDYDEDTLRQLLESRRRWIVERLWTNIEVRPDREVHWTNVLARRR
jgi:SAM-dependent methyltransferase